MLGNTLTKVETSFEPSVEITPLDSTDEGTYTLAMLDPDAPSHQDPKFGPFRHWIVSQLDFDVNLNGTPYRLLELPTFVLYRYKVYDLPRQAKSLLQLPRKRS